MKLAVLSSLAAASFTLPGCSVSPGEGFALPAPPAPLSEVASLGQRIFYDESLSSSGGMSCATCHSPANAFASPPGSSPVPLGGPAFTIPGFRDAPSLKYLALNPSFFFDSDGTPTGGFNRDGRASSLAAQARRPLLSAHEMANASVADVVAKVAAAPYVADFRAAFGDDIFAAPDEAFGRMLLALQRFELEDVAEFSPCSSKYDRFLAGAEQLSAREQFDDLPVAYRGNVNTTEVPYDRRAGDVPALSDSDIEDVIAFLNTLTDE
jgi:cytochrome c peroxidase